MEIGKDISQKIRSAIKAKLVELGAYVDDELPDYIMVMVANKKTKEQMTDDLGLFLNVNTEKFTSWLHGLLSKLQTLSTDKQKNLEIDRTQNECEKSQQPVEKKQRPSTKKEEKQTNPSSIKPKAKSSVKSSQQGSQKKSKDMTKTREEEYVPLLLDKTETDEFTEEFKEEEGKKGDPVKTRTNTVVSKLKPQIPHPEREMKARSVAMATNSATIASQVRPSVVGRPMVSSVKSRLGAIPKAVTSPMKRAASPSQDRKVSPPKKKKPMSVVGNVVKKYEEQPEEEYDPYNPSVGSVASVIKVSERKSSVPLSLQAKPSLLMKAVNAAEKSVTSTLQQVLQEEKMYSAKAPKRPVNPVQRMVSSPREQTINPKPAQPITVTLSGNVKKKGDLHLTSKSRREDLIKKMTYTISNDMPVEKPKRKPEIARVPPVMDSRRVHCVQKPNPPVVIKEEEMVEEEVEEHMLDEEDQKSSVASEIMDSPVEEDQSFEMIEKVKEEEEMKEEGSEEEMIEEEEEVVDDVMSETDPEIQQILVDEDNDLDLEEQEVHTVSAIQRLNATNYVDSRRFIQEKVLPVAKVNPKFIVTLDGVDADKYETCFANQQEKKQETKQVTSSVKLPEIKPISISLRDDSEEEEEEEEQEEQEEQKEKQSPLDKAKMQERCKFWPACVNGNSCQFHHPTIPCKMFPQCKFKDKCLYIHPNCKFDAKCTRNDCPFTHASKRGPVTTVVQKIVQVPVNSSAVPIQSYQPNKHPSQVTCRFFPNCKNVSCPFNHPMPCKFGLACTRKSFCTFYHPPLPDKDKLKWTANKFTSHISERKFDSPAPAKKLPTSIT